MKKIMFTDELTAKVLSGEKTSTLRDEVSDLSRVMIATPDAVAALSSPDRPHGFILNRPYGYLNGRWGLIHTRYSVGERVAVAQRYSDITVDAHELRSVIDSQGWVNKMFVRADLMPHVIEIEDVGFVKIKEIGEADALAEGVDSDDLHNLGRVAALAKFFKQAGMNVLYIRNAWMVQYKFKLIR